MMMMAMVMMMMMMGPTAVQTVVQGQAQGRAHGIPRFRRQEARGGETQNILKDTFDKRQTARGKRREAEKLKISDQPIL